MRSGGGEKKDTRYGTRKSGDQVKRKRSSWCSEVARKTVN